MTPAQMIGEYIACRDWLEADDAKHAERQAPVRQRMVDLEAAVTELLLGMQPDKSGKVNISIPGTGTAFRKSWTSAKVVDRKVFMDFVFGGRREGFLTSATSKEAVKEYMDMHNGELPPGIDFTTGWQTQFRKS